MDDEIGHEQVNVQETTCAENAAPKVEAETLLCKRCGAVLTEGQKFCPMCGQAISEEYTPNTVIEKTAPKKKTIPLKIVLPILAAFAIAGIALVVWVNNRTPDFQELYGKYNGVEGITIGSDGTWMRLDTNPDNKDSDDYDIYDYVVSDYVCNEIEEINSCLGFSSAVYEKMMETTAMQGRQTESTDQYTVSWTYHPDNGLEVMYEVKGK